MPRSCYWTLWNPCKYFWARVSKKPLTVCFNSILQQKIIAATFPEISNKEGTKKIWRWEKKKLFIPYVLVIALGRGGGGVAEGIRWWQAEEKWIWPYEPFSKLETTFCKYWASVKIKMTSVYNKYKGKIKVVQEQWLQLEMKFLFGHNMKIVIYWGGISLCWGIKIW